MTQMKHQEQLNIINPQSINALHHEIQTFSANKDSQNAPQFGDWMKRTQTSGTMKRPSTVTKLAAPRAKPFGMSDALEGRANSIQSSNR